MIATYVIIIGGVFLMSPVQTNAEALLSSCSSWTLSCDCDAGLCCSICEDDGSIGQCFPHTCSDPGEG